MKSLRSFLGRELVCRSVKPLAVESLEKRQLLAAFGSPWPQPRSLSVSFPTDQAEIGHYNNEIRERFDQVTDRLEWQHAVLRAFQTWAVHANINVGLVPDRGDDFGAVGLSSDDPRFGEFRIGAFSQGNVLANASPFQVNAGTWSGDVLLNTDVNYFLGDWESGNPIQVPDGNELGPAVELYSVLLHEAGNALGLADNNIRGSVMNGNYAGPNGSLKTADIRAIQELYGRRIDIYEPNNNGTRRAATTISHPAGFDGSSVVSVNGSLNTTRDIDFYRIKPFRGQEKVTIRLRAAGISLVKASLEVQDRFGNKIGDVKADSIFENNIQLEVGSLSDHPELFIRVAPNSTDVFGVGDYKLEIDYRPSDQQPSIDPPSFDADADDDDSPLSYLSVDTLFSQAGLQDFEIGQNDSLVDSTVLETVAGFLENTRYEALGSLSSNADRDLYRFRAPRFPSPLLVVDVDPIGVESHNLDVILLNANGDRVAADVEQNGKGGVSVNVRNPDVDIEYVLFVRTLEGSTSATGNYFAAASFATNLPNESDLVFSSSSSTTDHFSGLEINKTQLLKLDLSIDSLTEDTGLQLTIYNHRTGDIVTSFAAAVGLPRSSYVWLTQGSYVIRGEVRDRETASESTIRFSVTASVLSDDQGPRPIDPTRPPVTPNYEWTGVGDRPPIIQNVDPPYEDPWNPTTTLSLLVDYYRRFLL